MWRANVPLLYLQEWNESRATCEFSVCIFLTLCVLVCCHLCVGLYFFNYSMQSCSDDVPTCVTQILCTAWIQGFRSVGVFSGIHDTTKSYPHRFYTLVPCLRSYWNHVFWFLEKKDSSLRIPALRICIFSPHHNYHRNILFSSSQTPWNVYLLLG